MRVVLIAMLLASAVFAQELEEPVRLKADGEFIHFEKGHAAPHLVDWNGDGKRDLLVGQFEDGKLRIYLNGGTTEKPRYRAHTFFRAGGTVARVPFMVCIGFTPQVVDLDGDGHREVISGSYAPGHIYWFRSDASGAFTAGVRLRDETGAFLHGGLGRKGEDLGYPDIRATAPWMVDYDDDGDLDLLIGDGDGRIVLVLNKGTATAPKFSSEHARVNAAGEPIRAPSRHAGPHAADWDGDGRWDLLVGCGDGSVLFFRNVGEKGKPRFAAARALIGPSPRPARGSKPNRPLWRCKVCVADHDGDGRLDLLVGDIYKIKRVEPNWTDEEKARRDNLFKEHEKVAREFIELARRRDLEMDEQLPKLRKLQKRMNDLSRQLKAFEVKSDSGGSVWLYKRKAAAKK